MKFNLLAAVAACVGVTACSSHDYTVTANFPDNSMSGETVYLVNYDNGDTIASAVIDSNVVVIKGTVENPVAVNLCINRAKKLVVLEPGEINVSVDGKISGTKYNDTLSKFMDDLREDLFAMRALAEDPDLTKQQRDSIYNEVNMLHEKSMTDLYKNNLNNPLGYLGFIALTEDKSVAEIESLLADAPAGYADFARVNKYLQAAKNVEATQEGNPFVDFTVVAEDGTEVKFSDYVGKGVPVLVDFWASWCGPCRREIPNIKAIREKYGDKLMVLGVAVWDEPEATRGAIEELEIPWQQIINAQTIPTDIYGIRGIPHIMIIDADGTILSRGLQGEELSAKVDEIMSR
ncbi:MAG: AhpC/TSA family protein [Muribaculaceae bacterium]|nr:AhpC/TSA family protein [Muribaculaceae bacterium]